MPSRRRVLLGISFAVAASIAALAGFAWVRVSRSLALARESEAFQRRRDGARKRVLVAGDSTAVGTGAAHARASIAGRIGAAYPEVEVVNVAADGAKVGDVVQQIRRAPAGRYDLALIQAGGNDVIQFTPLEQLAADWRQVLETAAARADSVVMMPAGNVGTAPIFPAPLSWALTARARKASALARGADDGSATFIDLFHERDQDPFLRDPDRYYAADGLHPSAAGYALWFEMLGETGVLARALE